ncbi:MAG: adenylate/guanylate cyclase domain-containing protein [Candidatus Anammoxibacter sp.]
MAEDELTSSQNAGNNEKILVVDDDSFTRMMIIDILSTGGYSVIEVDNGKDALEKATSDKDITLLISDINMPEMSGIELIKELTARDLKIPVIVLTGNNDMSIAIDAMHSGASHYIVKDENIAETVTIAVKEVLEKEQIKQKNRQLLIDLSEKNDQLSKTIKEVEEANKQITENQKQLEIRNQFIRNTFGRYLSDEIVDSILDTPEGLKFGGEKREVTIMMSDLRGFTSIGEMLSPEGVVKMLNIYLDTMTELILKYNGTIDEFIGDGILTIFGAPILREDDASRAVACAIEMQCAMDAVNEKMEQGGLPEISMGIGINTGDIVVGNIGSIKRAKYGVVGKNVNLTSRIESYTIGGQILISESTLNACGSTIKTIDQMEVYPKGVSKPITIYEVGSIAGNFNLNVPEKKEINFVEMTESLPVKFTIVHGKHISNDFYDGKIVSLASEAAKIDTEQPVDGLSNLKISIFSQSGEMITDELCGKVAVGDNDTLHVNFTSIPEKAQKFFETILTP